MAPPGPPALGRGVVIGAADPVPAPWSGAAEVVVDDGATRPGSAVVEALHQAWARRQAVVVRLAVDPAGFRAPPSWHGRLWELDPAMDLVTERLQFLVWANNYDARRDPGRPVWWWARKATRLGAREGATEGPGDVILPDGRPAWIDGGPRAPLAPAGLGGAVLVHRESVERDRLSVAPEPRPPQADLAPDQLAAVAHAPGPARVVAPAGSGKTRVLTERLHHLLVDRGWEPDSVLAVAYNKKAQEELDARCQGLGARTRTLNSLGLWVLAEARGGPPRVVDEAEARRLVERFAPVRRRRANTDPIEPYLEGLSVVRLGLVDPAEVEAERDDVPGLSGLVPAYRDALRELRAVDFDEQIAGAVETLLADGELRQRLQARCRHLLVDELQDLTPAHVLLVRLLAAPAFDVFGVGDDDQVIYGHAGADPRFLIDYAALFPGAGDHRLTVNYRCPPAVVEAAGHLLAGNRRRVPKEIRAGRPEPLEGSGGEARPSGSTLEAARAGFVVALHPPGGGAAALAEVVERWRQAAVPAASIAVLARVNALLLAPHVALAAAGVPMSSSLGPDILARTGLRAALAYLRLAIAPDGHLGGRDLVEILRRPSRGLPPWFADRLRRRERWAIHGLADLASRVPDKDASKVERLVDDVVALRAAAAGGATTPRLLRLIRDDVGLGGSMTLLDRSKGEGSSHLDDLEALEQVAHLEEDPARFEPWLRHHAQRAADPAGVVLSTIHRVKGMEWDRVVVYGVTSGILPHRLAEDVEEERRVLHVAITRCREEVVVLADRSRPSSFLGELQGRRPASADASAGPTDGAGRPRQAPAGRDGPGRGQAQGDPALSDALRAWRRERSRQDGVPAYVVCSDKTLDGIAAARPSSLVALRQVAGIGPAKLERYGEEILDIVAGGGVEA